MKTKATKSKPKGKVKPKSKGGRRDGSCSAVRRPLKDETISRIVSKMPGGLKGFCVTWGWLTFARRIERAHKIR